MIVETCPGCPSVLPCVQCDAQRRRMLHLTLDALDNKRKDGTRVIVLPKATPTKIDPVWIGDGGLRPSVMR